MNRRTRAIVIGIWLTAGLAVAATIGTLTSLPDAGPIFTQADQLNINTNATTANTNFTNLNNAVGGGLNGLTITATTGTFTLTNAKTLAVSNSLTLAGTDSTTMTFPSTSATIARTDAANTFTGTQTIASLGGVLVDCATTAACPSTSRLLHSVIGIGTLASGTPSTYAVTTISPAFTSASTYNCYAQDATTIATNIGVLTAGYVSGSAVTFTGPNTNTDTFRFYCIGY